MKTISLCATAALALSTAFVPMPALSKVTGLEIVNTISPAMDGESFGAVGTYERIDAIAKFAINPETDRGRSIVDLDAAPRNSDGLVEYETEVTILRPTDPGKGNGVLFYDVPNRGRNLAFMLMNKSSGVGLPEAASDAGDGFLMREGYTIVWSGWQSDAPDELLNITLPIAEGITGLSREEFVFDKGDPVISAKLTYPAADMDPQAATLTVRQRPTDPRATAPGLSFKYLSPKEIEITRPEGLDSGAIYEFTYPATDARPTGLGFAATSDLISFLRGNPGHDIESPLDGINQTIALGISQSGRYLRDLIYQGFNADENGARVFDGAIPHIAGSRKTFTNYRFAQAGRYSRQHEDHDFPGDQFPFSYAEVTDPLSGQSGSVLSACNATNTCPKVMHTDTSTEFWQARAALVSTSPTGQPLEMPEDVRLYFIASAPHFNSWTATSRETATCRFPTNPISSAPVMRALLSAMTDWVKDGTEPPASRYPTLADGTLVPLGKLALPDTVSDDFVPVYNVLQVRDYDQMPPVGGAAYPVLVPQLDGDGNEMGGVAMPAVAAPLGTYWGWNLRKAGFAGGNLCGLTGSFLPLSAKEAAGDGRKPLDARYSDAVAYSDVIDEKARALVSDGLLLEVDIESIVDRAKATYVAVTGQ